ncbi:MAG: nucleotidyltransferase domain-containing protein [Atribacterota bacterium]
MSFKVERNKIIQLLKDYFSRNSSLYHIEIAFLYGSWSRGLPHKDSDIDLALLFSEHAENEDIIFESINNISFDLSIKMGKEVNIIDIKEGFPYPMLYYNAIIFGTPIYINNNDLLISLKLEAIRQMEDFKNFGIPWQQEVAQKLLKEMTHA